MPNMPRDDWSDFAKEAGPDTRQPDMVSRDKWEAQEKELCLCEQQLADARAEVERLRPALTGLLDAVDRKDMDSVDCRHFRPYQDKARETLAAPTPTTGEAERPTLTRPQREILHHTKWRAAGRMYCGARDDADIQSLIRLGYMRDCGTPGHLPDDDAYFTITETGLKALAAQQQESGE